MRASEFKATELRPPIAYFVLTSGARWIDIDLQRQKGSHSSVAIAIQRGNALAIQAGFSRAVMRAAEDGTGQTSGTTACIIR